MIRFAKPEQLPVGVGIVGFCSGNDAVDRWAAERSALARSRGTAVVYVSRCGTKVAGFYTLSAHSVARARVEGGWFVRNAPEQVPAILLGMMGVDEEYQGMGLGADLLRDAIFNASKIANLAGAKALMADPTDEGAAGFYEHFGFSRLPGTNRMALRLG